MSQHCTNQKNRKDANSLSNVKFDNENLVLNHIKINELNLDGESEPYSIRKSNKMCSPETLGNQDTPSLNPTENKSSSNEQSKLIDVVFQLTKDNKDK